MLMGFMPPVSSSGFQFEQNVVQQIKFEIAVHEMVCAFDHTHLRSAFLELLDPVPPQSIIPASHDEDDG